MVPIMKTITLKKIPQSVHASLKQRAKQHGRSLNKEALACLEMIVAPTKVNIDALLLDIRNHRASLPGKLNDQLIQRATIEGRP
jgi:plasmid stability protein